MGKTMVISRSRARGWSELRLLPAKVQSGSTVGKARVAQGIRASI